MNPEPHTLRAAPPAPNVHATPRHPSHCAPLAGNLYVGNTVYNHDARQVGYVKEVMLDAQTGKVGYAVLSFDQFFDLNDELFAVPKDALTVDARNQHLVLDLEQERLDLAPKFGLRSWPNSADPGWVKRIHAYYGTTPEGAGARA
jgi:sporulation protein YlmC with PRC-barrel domain